MDRLTEVMKNGALARTVMIFIYCTWLQSYPWTRDASKSEEMEEDESEDSEDKSLEPKDKTREHMDKKCIEHHARSLEPLCYWSRVFQAHIQMRQI